MPRPLTLPALVAMVVALANAAALAAPAPRPDPLIGTYVSEQRDIGTTRFASDGTLTTIMGAKGTWSAIDPRLGIYIVTIGDRSYTIISVAPGRFVTPDRAGIIFEKPR